MKNYLLFALTAFLLGCFHFNAQAQKVKLKEGNLDILKGITEMNVQYDFSQMAVGKYDKESDYIQKKKADYNKSEPGKGDRWEASWVNDRQSRFEPQFEELFNKYGPFKIARNQSTKYTMILKTTFTEPGFNVGVMRKNAYIDAEVWIVETVSPNQPLIKISIENSPGRVFGGYDFDTGERIQEAYAKAGKSLGKYLD